jgi:hypothetical protein
MENFTRALMKKIIHQGVRGGPADNFASVLSVFSVVKYGKLYKGFDVKNYSSGSARRTRR